MGLPNTWGNCSIWQALRAKVLYKVSVGFLPYLIPASEDGESGVDLSTLRTFRVLRPLKLVSGVPSKQNTFSFDRKHSAGNINSPIPRKSEIFYVKVLWKKKFRETSVSRAHSAVWKLRKFTLTEKYFVKSSLFTTLLLSRNFCQKYVRMNFRNYHTVQGMVTRHNVKI